MGIIPNVNRLLNAMANLSTCSFLRKELDEMEKAIYPSGRPRNLQEIRSALRGLLKKISESSNLDDFEVRKAWMLANAALNEDEEESLEDEEESLEDLEMSAKASLRGASAQREFASLLEDAKTLDASDEQLIAALRHVIDTGGCVLPMKKFLDEEEYFDDRYNDEDAATRLLFMTITSPEFPEFIQAHPEAMNFLL